MIINCLNALVNNGRYFLCQVIIELVVMYIINCPYSLACVFTNHAQACSCIIKWVMIPIYLMTLICMFSLNKLFVQFKYKTKGLSMVIRPRSICTQQNRILLHLQLSLEQPPPPYVLYKIIFTPARSLKYNQENDVTICVMSPSIKYNNLMIIIIKNDTKNDVTGNV